MAALPWLCPDPRMVHNRRFIPVTSAPPTGLLTIEEKRTQHKICIHQTEYFQESLLLRSESLLLRSESDADLSVNSGEDKPLLLLTGVWDGMQSGLIAQFEYVVQRHTQLWKGCWYSWFRFKYSALGIPGLGIALIKPFHQLIQLCGNKR